MNTREFPLSALPVGGCAQVSRLCADGGMRRRLLDLGMIAGTPVTCLQRSPAGDPTAYLIRGAVIALRRQDAGDVVMCDGERPSWG